LTVCIKIAYALKMSTAMLITAKRDAETVETVVVVRHTVAKKRVCARYVYTILIVKGVMNVTTSNAFGWVMIVVSTLNVQRIGFAPTICVFLDVTLVMRTARKRRHTVAKKRVDVKNVGLMFTVSGGKPVTMGINASRERITRNAKREIRNTVRGARRVYGWI